MRAIWKGAVLAQSPDTVVVEGNHYFPPDSLEMRFFEPSQHHTHCSWKGEASYYHLVVDGERNENAAWFYPSPFEAAAEIEGRVAFWRGVVVEE